MNSIGPDTGSTRDFYNEFRTAELRFNMRDYRGAIETLTRLIAELEDGVSGMTGVNAARELLARAYFHSALLKPAEEVSRQLLASNPSDAYAALLLARTLQRQSRDEEASQAFRMAAALGAPEAEILTSPSYEVSPERERQLSRPSA